MRIYHQIAIPKGNSKQYVLRRRNVILEVRSQRQKIKSKERGKYVNTS